MPNIQVPDYAQILRERLGLRGTEAGVSVSPEIVPIIAIDSFATPPQGGLFAGTCAPGGAGLRSEILVQYFPVIEPEPAWQLEIPNLWVTSSANGDFMEIVYDAAFSGFTQIGTEAPAYGDLVRGFGPITLGCRNNAVATAGTKSYLGGTVSIDNANTYVELPVNIVLRAFSISGALSAFVVRSTADNVRASIVGEWRLVPAVP